MKTLNTHPGRGIMRRTRQSKWELNDTELIEVVTKKTMTVADYRKIIEPFQKKGWNVKAFQIGKHSYGTQKEVK